MKMKNLNIKKTIIQLLIMFFLTLLIGFSINKLWRINKVVFLNKTNLLTIFYGGISLLILLTFFLVLKKMKKQNYLIALIPFIIVVAGRGGALISIIVFLFANLGLGMALFKKFKPDIIINIENTLFSFFIGMSINSYMIWVFMHFKINFQYFYYLFFLIQIVLFRRSLYNSITEVQRKIKEGYSLNASQNSILLAGIFFIFYALVPYYGWDSLTVHFHIPNYVLSHGMFHFSPQWLPALNTSIVPSSTYTSLFLMGGEYAIRLINILLIYFSFTLIEGFTRRRFNSKIAFFTTLISISTPFILWITASVFIDSFSFLSTTVVFIHAFNTIKTLSKKNVLSFFILSAFVFICKQQGIYVIILFGFIITLHIIKRSFKKGDFSMILYLLLGALIFSLILSPLLIHNFIVSGNPVFPFYNGVFQSDYTQPMNKKDMRWNQPLNLETLYDVSFYGSKYSENSNYSFGIWYFMFIGFIPLLFVGKYYRKYFIDISILLFVFFGVLFLLRMSAGLYIRYFISGGVFAGSVIIGLIIHRILGFMQNGKKKAYVMFLFWLVFSLNTLLQLSIRHIATPYPIVETFSHNYKKHWSLYVKLGIKKLFNYANLKYGKKSKGLLIGVPFVYFADFEAESIYGHFYHVRKKINTLRTTKDINEIYQKLFLDMKYDFIIMRKNSKHFINSKEFKKLLKKEFSVINDNYSLYVPKTKIKK